MQSRDCDLSWYPQGCREGAASATLFTVECCRPIHRRPAGASYLALRWANADLDTKIIRSRVARGGNQGSWYSFKRAKIKNGQRDITLPDIVVDALHEHRRQQFELRVAVGLGKISDDALVFLLPMVGRNRRQVSRRLGRGGREDRYGYHPCKSMPTSFESVMTKRPRRLTRPWLV